MMHEKNEHDNRQIVRCMNVTRRHHLNMNIIRDRIERFIKHCHNIDEIRIIQNNMNQIIHISSSLISIIIVLYEMKSKQSSILCMRKIFFEKCVDEHRLKNNEICSS